MYMLYSLCSESEKDLEEAEEYKEARLVLDSVKLEA
ncbi:PREDICTED: tubulin-specific chaperone A-like [Galeopterus variegatus]|uniref:Tubulin-specific chaperone A-like n=1 Tax=Galeopterus variegatus TaxID=482537 RepID=A0ABM0RJV3_GALVR|nr:PREDICTED: tubulin-specific chaperone A-like [Galeopterus variegatus]